LDNQILFGAQLQSACRQKKNKYIVQLQLKANHLGSAAAERGQRRRQKTEIPGER